MLREPLALLAEKCVPVWGDRDRLNSVLLEGFSSIPYCTYLYAVGTDGVQLSDHISYSGLTHEHYQLNRSERPYMKETMPEWGFLLSDAYISVPEHRPSLTALQVVVSEAGTLGYLGADFDLRGLPVTSALYLEPHDWRQVKGDPAMRSTPFQQIRTESPMDHHMQATLSILEELLAERSLSSARYTSRAARPSSGLSTTRCAIASWTSRRSQTRTSVCCTPRGRIPLTPGYRRARLPAY